MSKIKHKTINKTGKEKHANQIINNIAYEVSVNKSDFQKC